MIHLIDIHPNLFIFVVVVLVLSIARLIDRVGGNGGDEN